jgi:hypothetical protein
MIMNQPVTKEQREKQKEYLAKLQAFEKKILKKKKKH